ncbi:MAG: sodium/proton antiporter NhaB, partial [Enterobacteriaceae bacterium]
LVAEFIFTLAMALKCYPLQPGGLLTIEAVAIGMTDSAHVKQEVMANFEVILLLIFMVAGIYFMKQLLLFVFTKLLIRIHSKIILSFSFCAAAAFLSAFLDALTVIAVVISVGIGFHTIYHKVVADLLTDSEHDINRDDQIANKKELEQFRSFLRSLLMHAGVGTALGGVMTMVGEPQNLIIAKYVGWDFVTFFLRMAPVTVPTLVCGFLTCILVERFRLFGYGATLPDSIYTILADYDQKMSEKRTKKENLDLIFQALVGIWLVVALALHLAEVGLIGLTVIILTTSFCGVTEEHDLGKAFQDALPFTALITVFFAVVAVIIDQSLFSPIINLVLSAEPKTQLSMFYLFNGLLSAVSDNVFVATIYINEARQALEAGTISLEQYNLLGIAINTGTNLPSVATPNGQAAFLFLLTSALAPLIHLSYGRMVIMALPYTIVLTLVGLAGVEYLLHPLTELMYQWNLLTPPVSLPTL